MRPTTGTRKSPGEKLVKDIQEAKQFVTSLMSEAANIECELEGRKSHDREVGKCRFIVANGERVDPQAEVVKAGLARDCPRYSGGRYKRFETSESKALPFPNNCKSRVVHSICLKSG